MERTCILTHSMACLYFSTPSPELSAFSWVCICLIKYLKFIFFPILLCILKLFSPKQSISWVPELYLIISSHPQFQAWVSVHGLFYFPFELLSCRILALDIYLPKLSQILSKFSSHAFLLVLIGGILGIPSPEGCPHLHTHKALCSPRAHGLHGVMCGMRRPKKEARRTWRKLFSVTVNFSWVAPWNSSPEKFP